MRDKLGPESGSVRLEGGVVLPFNSNTLDGRVALFGKLLFDDKSGRGFGVNNSLSGPLDKTSSLVASGSARGQPLVTASLNLQVGAMRDGYQTLSPAWSSIWDAVDE